LRRIFFVGLIVAFLSSCSAQFATSDDAPRASAGEVTTSAEEALTGEETTAEPTTSTTVDSPEFSQNTSASPAIGTYGMVSSANPLATQAGWKILAEGGNAFDAAVAVAAALGVVEPMMSGVGGYGAIVVYDAEEGETQFLDSGSRTPAALDPAVFRPPTPNYVENRCGAKAVTTPGNVDAWETLSEDYGNLEWGRLFDPAIELADEGFVLGDITAGWVDASFPYFPEHAQSIYGNNGVPLRAGERLVQEDLARSLDVIAEQGAGAMHEGELGQAVAATMRENDGFLTLEDLSNNRVEWRNTISIDHRGYEVVTASPPLSSWGILLRLGIMGQFNLQAPDHNSATYLHTFTEASTQAGQASQDYAVDPESGRTPLDLLLSEGFWAEQAARINPSQAAPNLPPTPFAPTSCPPQSYSLTGSTNPQGTPNEPQQHTTHFVVADREGNVVSATQTLGNIFGSKVMPEGTGIWLNDSIA
jgi:gamma-glutamyltranspeptidase / glutathione hydrolase